MIFDHISHSSRYESMHKGFKQAFEFLRNFNNTQDFNKERLHLEGNNLIAIIEPGQGKSRAGAKLEAHRQYIDIQYTVEGLEEIGWRLHSDCDHVTQPYDSEKDIEFFGDTPTLWLPVPPNYFAVFFSQDAHAPLATNETVRKIIMKIAI